MDVKRSTRIAAQKSGTKKISKNVKTPDDQVPKNVDDQENQIDELTQTIPDKENVQTPDDDEMQSIRSFSSSHTQSSNKSSLRRRQLEIHLAYEKQKLEKDKQELQVQREEQVLDLELQLKLAELEEENMSIADEKVSVCHEEKSHVVEHWLRDEAKPDEGKDEKTVSTNYNLEKLISRNAMSQNLPIFSGEPTEWPNFITLFKISTKICNFSPEEN